MALADALIGATDLHPAELECPSCGGANLHHDVVVVRGRDGEDRAGTHVEVSADGKVTTRRLDTNSREWWGRRHELVVSIWCENCPELSDLVIAQHKGATLVFMRPARTLRSVQ